MNPGGTEEAPPANVTTETAMPRFENTDTVDSESIYSYCRESGNGSSTFDLCRRCGKKADGQPLSALNLTPYNGEPAGVFKKLDAGDHPPYGEEQDYACDCCGRLLNYLDE